MSSLSKLHGFHYEFLHLFKLLYFLIVNISSLVFSKLFRVSLLHYMYMTPTPSSSLYLKLSELVPLKN